MTDLVTGATGFVGAAVARALCTAGEQVRVLARPGGDRRNLAGLPVEIVDGDLTDRASLDRAVTGCRRLFHVAADYRIWVRDPVAMDRVNVDGSLALLDAATEAGVDRIVYTSSVATIVPHADGSAATEDSPSTPESIVGVYKLSKFRAEAAVRDRAENGGTPVVIVNPSAPIGPGDIKPTPTGQMIADAVAGRTPAYVDTGLNLVHVDDVAAGHLLAADRGVVGRRYILGGENLTLKEILVRIARLSGRRPPRVRLPHGLVTTMGYIDESMARLLGTTPRVTVDSARMARKAMYYDSTRARDELGYCARPVDEALADAVAWFTKAAG